MKVLQNISEIIERDIASISYRDEPQGLYEAISYTLGLGGKRMRPLLAASVYLMYRKNIEDVLPLCRAVEVFHNFTLLHDDIMDEAPLRRGKETVYKKWDANTAILSGDVMLVQSYQYLLELKSSNLEKLITSFNEGAIKVCEGQQFDMNFEDMETVTVKQYIHMIYLKTAALLEHTVDMTGILTECSEEDRLKLRDFAKYTGISFQLRDDWLDAFGDMEKVGKQKGGDILANKKTYLMLKAEELANETQLDTLKQWCTTEGDDERKVEAVLNIFEELNIPEITNDKVREYYEKGVNSLRSLSVDSDIKEELIGYLDQLMQRES